MFAIDSNKCRTKIDILIRKCRNFNILKTFNKHISKETDTKKCIFVFLLLL